ncbi:MAG: metallophosphoesterase [Candidatus Helarchaeota archaeon]
MEPAEIVKYIPNSPAILIKKNNDKVLIVSDLHLGIEHAQNGLNVPSQTSKIINDLIKLIRKVQASEIILLGDIKHSIPQITPKEWLNIPKFFKEILKIAPISIVLGNHDGDIDALISSEIKTCKTLLFSIKKYKIGLIHGHTMIPPSFFETDIIIVGHNHPVIEFEDNLKVRSHKPVWIRTKWNKRKIAIAYLQYRQLTPKKSPVTQLEKKFNVKIKNPDIIVMPAFNKLIKGYPINKKPLKLLGPIFQSGAIKLNEAEIIMLDSTYLGKLGELISGE